MTVRTASRAGTSGPATDVRIAFTGLSQSEYVSDPMNDRAVFRWLVTTSFAVVVALVVGGITRLTESGLSITEWRPVSGVFPPLTAAEWTNAYQSYLQIPEAQTVHKGISLSAFKTLYWWEWMHRMLGRLVGLVIAVPFFVLHFRKQIHPRLWLRLASLPILVAMQGVLGWYMVKSGLTGRSDVSQYRLVAHLGLALLIYVIATWTAMSLVSGRPVHTAHGPHRTPADRTGIAVASLAFITILSGGFVAGLDAGHVFNTFPLMGGQVVPAGYGQLAPFWRNWFENAGAAQFNHRLLAVLTMLVALAASLRRSAAASDPKTQRAWRLVGATALIQFGLGIATLLLAVPIAVAALHQLGAVALVTAAMWACFTVRAPYASPVTASRLVPRTSATTPETTADA